MAILNFNINPVGNVGLGPQVVYFYTNDTVATVSAAGYLNHFVNQGNAISNSMKALVTTIESVGADPVSTFYDIVYSGGNWSFTQSGEAGGVVLPTVANYISHFTGTTGTMSSAAANIINAGNIQAGLSGTAGILKSFPATATTGSLNLTAVANSGDFAVTLSNQSHGQATAYSVSDIGAATGTFLTSTLAATNPNANLVAFDITVGQAALASAGTVTLYASSGAKQFKIRSLYVNSGGTNFSGGGGNRLATISDGTTAYSVIPAASLQTLANSGWGITGLPYPASAAINTSTVAGQGLRIAYSGGTTDYTAGSVVISGVLERVA